MRRATGDAFVRPSASAAGGGRRCRAARRLLLRLLFLLLGLRLLRLLGLLFLLFLLGAVSADAPLLPPPIDAIVSPTASVSPSWATIFSVPSWSAS